MVRIWYIDSETPNPRLENHKNPPEYRNLEYLYENTGVEYFKLNPETYLTDGVLDEIKRKRGYTYEDEVICAKAYLQNYEEQMKKFYTEHLHKDEEIRLILDGSGYFDVRDRNDNWIRIEVGAGDMLVMPGGIYHRFTLDIKDYLKAKRFFIGQPFWKAYYRPADDMDCRKQYVKKLELGFRKE